MATTGLLDPLSLSSAGAKGVVPSGDAWDALVARVNMLCAPALNPTVGAGTFYVSKGGIILDLSLLDQRLSNVEARINSANVSAICNGANIDVTLSL